MGEIYGSNTHGTADVSISKKMCTHEGDCTAKCLSMNQVTKGEMKEILVKLSSEGEVTTASVKITKTVDGVETITNQTITGTEAEVKAKVDELK